jgi:hypothetical protein
MSSNVSLEQALQSYRVMNTPTKYSWKQHWAQETFSNDDALLLSVDERKQFSKRLEECQATIFPNLFTSTGTVGSLRDLVNTAVNPEFKNTKKTNRHVIYSTSTEERPVGETAFTLWNGFQVIDLDIKDATLAREIKKIIFDKLKNCNWFLGVCLSSSKMGLHVWTKIAVPEKDNEDVKKKRLLFLTNFRHKYSFVYLSILSGCEKLGYTKNDILKWMDLSMFKPQQGAIIGYDPHPLISSHFFEDFIYVNFDSIDDVGCPELDWITYPDLKEVFKRFDTFVDDERNNIQVSVIDKPLLEFDTHNKVHYKHNERWRLANTLVSLYGFEQGYRYLRMITSNAVKDKELQADCITANKYKKPVDPWAVDRLNNVHGFKIKLNIENDTFDESEIFSAMKQIENPVLIKESKYYKEFKISKDQYLGNIRYDILDACGRLTLLEAGPGLGKTEMVKMLAKEGKKVMLVLPFTSVIKSKTEGDKDWYYSYGNRAPRLDVAKGLSLTIDKFSRLNLMDVKANGFNYIFIDESHLMFMSEYRPVMAKVVEMIRNTEIPIIMMSGTPSGELVFFPDAVHLKVIKEETRQKVFKVNLVDSSQHLMFQMCRAMANDIANGKRVLFPTNNGTLYSKQINAAVTYFLQHEHAIYEPLRLQYYKKSNVGEDFMDDVNFKKTIKDIQVLLCSSYLSVGSDILDSYNFEIYFADLYMPHELDQWSNRIRKTNLFVNLYVAKNDAEGNSRSLHKFKPLDFKLNDEEIKNVHSILRICNEMIERNPVEYRYNSLVSSIIRDNKFIEYNELDNKYYLNEIAYKVIYFERKYREYVQQLPVIMKGMQAYGYEIQARDLKDFKMEGMEDFSNLKDMVKLAYDEQLTLNTTHIEELMDIITEDRLNIYKEVLRGRFDIKKGNEWKEDLSNNKMIVKNIEVFEKVVPIFVSLSKQYEMDQIRDIFEHCRNKNGTFNFAAIGRVRTLVNIMYNDKNERLDLPIKEFMMEAYEFSDLGETTKSNYNNFLRSFAIKYANRVSTDIIKVNLAAMTMDDMVKKFDQIFKCLVKCGRPKRDGKFTMERVELLWPERTSLEDNIGEMIDNSFIGEFLGNQ